LLKIKIVFQHCKSLLLRFMKIAVPFAVLTALLTFTLTTTTQKESHAQFVPFAFWQEGFEPFTWTGLAGDNDWENTGNWSSGQVPGSGDVAKFRVGACLGANCNADMTANVDVAGVDIESGFLGTITQNSGVTIDVGTDGWVQEGGTFAGGDAAIDINGVINLSGGAFTSTSGDLNFDQNLSIGAAVTFTHNSGTFISDATNTNISITSNGKTFSNFTLAQSSNVDRATTLNDDLYVSGDLTVNQSCFTNSCEIRGGNSIYVSGDYVSTSVDVAPSGDVDVHLVGTGSQTISGSAPLLPLVINSTGTVNFSNDFTVMRVFDYVSGSVNLNGYKMTYMAGNGIALKNGSITPGAITFYDVEMIQSVGFARSINITGTWDIDGDLTIATGGTGTCQLAGGTIQLSGNLDVTPGCGGTSTTNIEFNASVDQTITHAGGNISIGGAWTVNKTAGNLVLASDISLSGAGQDMDIQDGDILMNSNNLTIDDTLSMAAGTTIDKGCSGVLTVGGSPIAAGPYDSGMVVGSAESPSISIADTSITEGGNLVFQLSISDPMCSVATNITYTTNDGTATLADSDYTDNDSTLIVSAGDANPTITVATTTDATFELDEYLSLQLTGTNQGSISDSEAIGLIVNDDAGGVVWSGDAGDGDWENNANWVGGTKPGPSDVAIFNAECADVPANCDANITASISLASILLSPGYEGTLTQGAGSSITLSDSFQVSEGTFTASNSSIDIANDYLQTGGTVNWGSASVNLVGDLRKFAGTFNAQSSSHTIDGLFNSSIIVANNLEFNNLIVAKGNGQTVTLQGVVGVIGDLTLDSSSVNCTTCRIFGGELHVEGNINLTDWSGGDTLIKAVGSGNQTITGSLAGRSSSLEIDATGTVNLVGTIYLDEDFIITSGTVNVGTSNLQFTSNAGTTLDTNGVALYDLTIKKQSGGDVEVIGTVVVNNDLVVESGGSNPDINSGTIEVNGDVSFLDHRDGTALIKMTGSGTQSLTGAAGGGIPDFEFASTGTVNLVGTIKFVRDVTYTSGTVVAGSSTVEFDNRDATLDTAGITFNDVVFSKTGTNVATLTSDMTVNGNLTIAQENNGTYINGSNIYVSGNLSVNDNANAGSTNIHLVGTGNQTITQVASQVIPGTVLTMNKSGGTVTQTSNLSLSDAGQDLVLTDGTWDVGSFDLTIDGDLTINDSPQAYLNNCGTVTVGGTISDPGGGRDTSC